MVMFNSYVKLPEGIHGESLWYIYIYGDMLWIYMGSEYVYNIV